MSMFEPRYKSAQNESNRPPGNWEFWVACCHQVDSFAYTTALKGKGGPFGASLWVFHEPTDTYVLVGNIDSNAVVSKGIASAHAEDENLCPANRREVVEFLRRDQREQLDKLRASKELKGTLGETTETELVEEVKKAYAVVQVSSGESCQSCRSKQICFAEELVSQGLLCPRRFHVVYKTCYERTYIDAGFNDAPYDALFRVVKQKKLQSLFEIQRVVNEDEEVHRCVESDTIVSLPVVECILDMVPKCVADLIDANRWGTPGGKPFAIVVSNDLKRVLSTSVDERIHPHTTSQGAAVDATGSSAPIPTAGGGSLLNTATSASSGSTTPNCMSGSGGGLGGTTTSSLDALDLGPAQNTAAGGRGFPSAPAQSSRKLKGTASSELGDEKDGEKICSKAGINAIESSVIAKAIVKACLKARSEGTFESWDLNEAVIYTNVQDIGPVAVGESLWSNIHQIAVIVDLVHEKTELQARELGCLSNWEMFQKCADEYNTPESSIQVAFAGSFDEPSVAHLFWKAKIMHEDIERSVGQSIGDLVDNVIGTDGFPATLLKEKRLQRTSSSHYNGKSTSSGKTETSVGTSPGLFAMSPADKLPDTLAMSGMGAMERSVNV